MPITQRQGVALHYQVLGEGPPLLLLMGFGMDHQGWMMQIPDLQRDFRLILMDNRGVGRSDAPPGPYSVREMASDAVAVLDACEVEQAHVVGLSMGGMIALQMALEHGRRMNRLVLACTTACLGEFGERTVQEVSERMGLDLTAEDPNELADVNMEQVARELIALSFSRDMIEKAAPMIEQLLQQALRWLPTPQVLHAQYAGIRAHNVADRLGEIQRPTLVMTAGRDRLIPPEQGEAIAAGIQGATLRAFAKAGHAINMERAPQFNQAVRDFLRS
jgi:pimeloyl-ACP methyl ester carboxylesterase